MIALCLLEFPLKRRPGETLNMSQGWHAEKHDRVELTKRPYETLCCFAGLVRGKPGRVELTADTGP
jgi:hypothetical protein